MLTGNIGDAEAAESDIVLHVISELKLKTARLVAIPVQGSDLDDWLALHKDPSVSSELGPLDEDTFVQYVKHWGRCYGLWTFRLEDGTFVGYAGLTHCWLRELGAAEKVETAQLRICVVTESRRRQYGAEMAEAVVDDAVNRCKDLPKVVAVTDPSNESSRCLLKKCGFCYERAGDIWDSGDRLELYRWSR